VVRDSPGGATLCNKVSKLPYYRHVYHTPTLMCAKKFVINFGSFIDIGENAEWPRFFWPTLYIRSDVACKRRKIPLPGEWSKLRRMFNMLINLRCARHSQSEPSSSEELKKWIVCLFLYFLPLLAKFPSFCTNNSVDNFSENFADFIANSHFSAVFQLITRFSFSAAIRFFSARCT